MKIFISHSHSDKSFVDRLSHELISKRFYLWIDKNELKPNQTLDSSIHTAINECSHFCIVLSAASVSSEWCLNELELALEKEKQEQRKCVYLLLMDDCIIPEKIKNRLSIDFRSSFNTGLNKLLFYLGKEKDLSYGNIYDNLYKRDFAIDWGVTNFGPYGDFYTLEVTSISFEPNKDYSILAKHAFLGQMDSLNLFENYRNNNEAGKLNEIIIQSAYSNMKCNPRKYIMILKDGKKVKETIELYCNEYNLSFTLVTEARILGDLPDNDVHFNHGSIIEAINNRG